MRQVPIHAVASRALRWWVCGWSRGSPGCVRGAEMRIPVQSLQSYLPASAQGWLQHPLVPSPRISDLPTLRCTQMCLGGLTPIECGLGGCWYTQWHCANSKNAPLSQPCSRAQHWASRTGRGLLPPPPTSEAPAKSATAQPFTAAQPRRLCSPSFSSCTARKGRAWGMQAHR